MTDKSAPKDVNEVKSLMEAGATVVSMALSAKYRKG
jgi:hypothetical protein